MKLGVLSDVHSNLVALDAVPEDEHRLGAALNEEPDASQTHNAPSSMVDHDRTNPHLSTLKTDIRPRTSSA